MAEKKFYHCVVSLGTLMGVYHIIAENEDEAKNLAIQQFERDKDMAYYREDPISDEQVIVNEVGYTGTPKTS